MRKFLVASLVAVCSFGAGLNFKSLQSDFTQTVFSEGKSVNYKGRFYAKNDNTALWIYESPTPKRIYFDKDKVVEIEENVQASLYQFPFKLAYALTIHKSQGMSINSLICNINHIFAKGQLYVALSRAVNPKNLKLFYDKKSDFRQHLRKVVKIDDEVKKFYQENVFLHIKESL